MFSKLFKATVTERNNIQKAQLRLLKFIVLSAKIDSNFGNHLWFDTRVGPMELSFGLRYWDESPEAVKRYEEDFNIITMEKNLSPSDA
jgi:hypothetical protein|tara:strand:+ start:887 stop:1150 length:264 start_codon:yes stop_codon:yes gene_type:complete